MQREIDQLAARSFDVLVVGGGIIGLTVACDAALRGLSVALVERRDFGSGTSFNHLRTLHGGLRYLQTMDLGRARESIRERSTLARIAPAAIRPLPFVLPLPMSLARGRLAMRAAFALDAVLGRQRNEGVLPSHHLPGGYVIGRPAAVARYPLLRDVAFTSAAVWHDYVMTDADRLTLSWGLAAADQGAVLANYAEAVAFILGTTRCAGARVRDLRSGRTFDIDAQVTVNATGGSLDELLGDSGHRTGLPMLKAMNLVTNRNAPAAAIGGRAPSGRTLFMVPWKGRALFGTWESPRPCAPTDTAVHTADVSAFLAEINHAYPSMALTLGDVTLVHRGVVPARTAPDGGATLQGHEQIVDHAGRGPEGLISVAGTKYTTARAVAERVVDVVVARLRRPAVPCRTAVMPLPLPDLAGDALLAHAAAHEMVVTLEDAVVRRTSLGALGDPGHAALARAADVVGHVLGWAPETRAAEVAALKDFYGTSNA